MARDGRHPTFARVWPVVSRQMERQGGAERREQLLAGQVALAEISRVLRPGGRLRFFEHVAAERPAHLRLQRALDATVWPRLAGECHTARETVSAVQEAGLEVTSVEQFRFPDTPLPTPTSPHALGEAVVARAAAAPRGSRTPEERP